MTLSSVTNGGFFVPGGLCEKRSLKGSLSLSSGERQACFRLLCGRLTRSAGEARGERPPPTREACPAAASWPVRSAVFR